MEKEKIIQNIVNDGSLYKSKELLSWIRQSDENRKEYIRYKNVWALLQRGQEMDAKNIESDFRLVKSKIQKSKSPFSIYQFIKYAAIIIVAVIGGYLLNYDYTTTELSMNEISVPNGNRSLVTLPDGSTVWLANGSKLGYPNIFESKYRKVHLEGEAFFSVARNGQTPFIVDIGEQQVKVLGTEFSVIAYPGDNIVQVDLISGKIQFNITDKSGAHKSYIVNPLHSLVLDKTSGRVENLTLPENFYRYWLEGVYEFRNESFENLAKKVERIYSVKIIFEDDILREKTFTGAFYIDSNIYTIMETFKRASGVSFDYSIDKNRIYLKHIIKQPMQKTE